MNKTNLGNKEIFIRNFNRYLAKSGKKKIDISRALGVSTGTLADWTNGRSYPRMDKIQKLADFFGIQKSDLVEDNNFAKDEISDKQQQVLDLFRQIPDDKKDFAIKMLEAMRDS
jgi:repressor LexA